MPLIPKPNYNQIFASQAPDIDKPAVFNNYPEGWGAESRPNNGKPTIKGFNYLQQTSDLKDLWILQNGACLPYDESIEYAEGAPVLKDGVIQYKTASGFSPAISEKPYILKYFTEGVLYPLNARVMLENGDIVRSTVAGNTVNPNMDLTGWFNFEKKQEIKNSLTVDLLDFIPEDQWPAIFDGTSEYDCAPAIQEAISSGARVNVSKSGVYIFKTPSVFESSVSIHATAPDVWFDFSQVPTTSVGLLVTGSLTDLVTSLPSQINMGDRSVILPSTEGLMVGDYLAFWNPTAFSYSPYRDYYRDGTFKQIIDISGDEVFFTEPFKRDFLASTLNVYKMNLVNFRLDNIKVKYFTEYTGNSAGAGALRASLARVETNNLHGEGRANNIISFSRCPNPVLNNTTGFNLGHPTGGGGTDYFILFGNCQDWVMNGGDIYSRRHAIAQGSSGLPASVPCSGGRAINFTGIRNFPNATVGAFDMHGNVEDCQVIDSTIHGAIKFGGGGDNFAVNCKIYGDNLRGRIAFGAEILGGVHGIIGGELISYKSPTSGSLAFVDWGSNNNVLTENVTKDFTFVCKGVKVNLYAAATNDYFIRIPNRGTSAKINIEADDISFNSNVRVSSCVRIDTISGTPNSDFIIVDNIYGNNAPVPLSHAHEGYKQFPHRLPIMQGVRNITTTASSSIATSGISYAGYQLPKRPHVSLTITGEDGSEIDTIAGQSTYQAVASRVGVQTFTARLKAPDSFTAGTVVSLSWQASIREC